MSKKDYLLMLQEAHEAELQELKEELEWRKKAGEILDIKPQHKIEIKVNGVHIASYYADFRVVLADGTIQYDECLKWKLVNALKDELLEPGAELIIIK